MNTETRFGVSDQNSEIDNLAARIRKCAELVGSGDALSQETAIPRRTLETYLSGNAEPKAQRLALIAKAAHVSVDWLVTGEDITTSESDDFALIPRYDVEVSAGHGAQVDVESEVGRFAFRKDWLRQEGLNVKDLALVTVRGDSMEPTIREGSMVLVDTSECQVSDDAIYVLRVDDTHLVAKRLQMDFDGGVYIRSDNLAYETQHLNAGRVERLTIVGRVVWSGGKI